MESVAFPTGSMGQWRNTSGADDGSRTIFTMASPQRQTAQMLIFSHFHAYLSLLRLPVFRLVWYLFGTFSSLFYLRADVRGDFLKIAVEQVGVGVQRHRRETVAEHPLYGLDVRAAGYGYACGGVSKIMDRETRTIGLFERPTEPLIGVVMLRHLIRRLFYQSFTVGPCEHQGVTVTAFAQWA